MVFRKSDHLAKGEKWFLDSSRIDAINQYKYLEFGFTTKKNCPSDLLSMSYQQQINKNVCKN